MRLDGLALFGGLVLGVVGCGDAPLALEPMQQRVVEAPNTQALMAEALVVLRRDFGRAQIDSAAQTITTAPVEFSTQRDSGTTRDLYGGRSSMRRIATFQAGRRGDAIVARVRVDIERRETRQNLRSTMDYHGPFSDTPGENTPITQDAATSASQNSTWVKTRRDSTMERQILTELTEYFDRRSAANMVGDEELAAPAGERTPPDRPAAPPPKNSESDPGNE